MPMQPWYPAWLFPLHADILAMLCPTMHTGVPTLNSPPGQPRAHDARQAVFSNSRKDLSQSRRPWKFSSTLATAAGSHLFP